MRPVAGTTHRDSTVLPTEGNWEVPVVNPSSTVGPTVRVGPADYTSMSVLSTPRSTGPVVPVIMVSTVDLPSSTPTGPRGAREGGEGGGGVASVSVTLSSTHGPTVVVAVRPSVPVRPDPPTPSVLGVITGYDYFYDIFLVSTATTSTTEGRVTSTPRTGHPFIPGPGGVVPTHPTGPVPGGRGISRVGGQG